MELNSKFSTKGNHLIDQLFFLTESLDCISTVFKRKIDNLGLWIITNSKGHEKEIINAISELEIQLKIVNIFSENFIKNILDKLTDGLTYEMSK